MWEWRDLDLATACHVWLGTRTQHPGEVHACERIFDASWLGGKEEGQTVRSGYTMNFFPTEEAGDIRDIFLLRYSGRGGTQEECVSTYLLPQGEHEDHRLWNQRQDLCDSQTYEWPWALVTIAETRGWKSGGRCLRTLSLECPKQLSETYLEYDRTFICAMHTEWVLCSIPGSYFVLGIKVHLGLLLYKLSL